MPKKIKDNIYILKIIIIPLMTMSLISYFLGQLITMTAGIEELPIYEDIKIAIPQLILNNLDLFSSVALFVILISIMYKLNKKKEFFPTDYYGDCGIIWYFIARYFLGYKEINLQNKPIYLHFALLKKQWFNINEIDTNYPEKDIEYVVDSSKIKDETQIDSVNFIISDTYKINEEQIPEPEKNNITVHVKRKNSDNGRCFSNNLIDVVEKELKILKNRNVPINIFWTTNPKTNRIIIQKLFLTGNRDFYRLSVFQQSDKGNRKFNNKPKKITFK